MTTEPTVLVRDPVGSAEDWLGKVAHTSDGPTVVRAPFELRHSDGTLVAFGVPRFAGAPELHLCLPKLKYSAARRTNGMLSRSNVFGYMPREPLRRNYCRAAALNTAHPEIGELLERVGVDLAGELLRRHPAQHAAQAAMVAGVPPMWRMRSGVYTSGIVNFNNQLVYHLDRGNFHGAWNAMMIIRRGCSGGHLVLPTYGVTVEYGDGDAIWSDAGAIVHGVTAMTPQRADGYRISVVWYALAQMCNCGSLEDEVERVRASKLNAARKRTTAGADALRAELAAATKPRRKHKPPT